MDGYGVFWSKSTALKSCLERPHQEWRWPQTWRQFKTRRRVARTGEAYMFNLVDVFFLYCIHCIVMHCIALYLIVPYYFIESYCILFYCIVLFCIILHCIVLYLISLIQVWVWHSSAQSSINYSSCFPASADMLPLPSWSTSMTTSSIIFLLHFL